MLGGDSFPQLTVEEGREALYLRFEASGEVCENRRSQTYYQNQSRNNPGAADRPDELGADVPPDWVLVSTTGSYAWHDHRIHWMSPITLPFLAVAEDSGEERTVGPDADEPQLTGSIWMDPVPAGIPLLGWVITNIGAVTAPIVPPGRWPDVLVRIAVGAGRRCRPRDAGRRDP